MGIYPQQIKSTEKVLQLEFNVTTHSCRAAKQNVCNAIVQIIMSDALSGGMNYAICCTYAMVKMAK